MPIVETLYDIYLNKEISIASSSKIFEGFGKRIFDKNEMYFEISTTIIDFEEKFQYSEFKNDHFKEYFFRKLIKGEIVIMMTSKKVEEFRNNWQNQEKLFQISSHKYGHNYAIYPVIKDHPQAGLIKYL